MSDENNVSIYEPGRTPVANLEININLAGIASLVNEVAKAATYMVSIGHHAAANLTEESLDAAGRASFDFGHKVQPWSLDSAKEVWLHWVLMNAFKDVAEAVSSTLEQVHQVLCLWKLNQGRDPSTPIHASVWNAEIVGRNRKFHRLTLPDKAQVLVNEYGLQLDDTLKEMVMSINAVRNCLVHRRGIVADKDLKDGETTLAMRYRTLEIGIDHAEGFEPIQMPYENQSGDDLTLALRLVDRERQFAIGEKIALSTQEFSAICWTQFIFAQDAANRLEQYGRDKGINITAPIEKPPT